MSNNDDGESLVKAGPTLKWLKWGPLLQRAIARAHWRIIAALGLLAMAAWMPDVSLPRDTSSTMVTFDITQSMNVADVTHDGVAVSRLALARAAMRETLLALPCGSKVGWSIFADYRSFALLLPIEVCSNYDVLLSTLDRIDGRMRWANASNVGKGVYWALRNADEMPGTNIIFITDGQEAPPLPSGQLGMPATVADATGPGGWLIGVGGDLPSRMPRSDASGRVIGYWGPDDVVQVAGLLEGQDHEHLSELRAPHLMALARQSGLAYARLDSAAALRRAMLDPALATRALAPTNLRPLPALLALLLLVWVHWPDLRFAQRRTRRHDR